MSTRSRGVVNPARPAAVDGEAEGADRVLLRKRLQELGLPDFDRVVVHENRTVLVSASRGVLRVHRGYAYAPDRVLRDIIRFVTPGARGASSARDRLLEFPVHDYVPAARRGARRLPSVRGADASDVRKLEAAHRRLNRVHFGGLLSRVPIRISRRMKTRLGEITVDPGGDRVLLITISKRHIRTDGWDEVEHTMLHEMVHQWQVENGWEADHGARFREKAKEVGIEPRAERALDVRHTYLQGDFFADS